MCTRRVRVFGVLLLLCIIAYRDYNANCDLEIISFVNYTRSVS